MKDKYVLILDSSQIERWFFCPQSWAYLNEELLLPKGQLEELNVPMNAGTFGHRLLDIYYKAQARGLGMNQAFGEAMAFDFDNEYCKCGRLLERHSDPTCPCKEPTSRPFPLEPSERQKVVNRLIEYCAKWAGNDVVPDSPESVEVGFSEPIFEDDSNLFVLEGRIDVKGSIQGLSCILDHKFQYKKNGIYKKSIQFKNYCLVDKTPLMVVNYIRLTKECSPDTLMRDLCSFSIPELLLWKERLVRIFFEIKGARLSGIYPRNWGSCGGRRDNYGQQESGHYKHECPFTMLCDEWNKDLIQIKKDTYFDKRESCWRPW